MTKTIQRVILIPQPREQVWRAITDRTLLAEWMFPNDFLPRVGHRFTFQVPGNPTVNFDGLTVHCEVLECESPGENSIGRLVFSWSAGALANTQVSFHLEPDGDGTRILFEHSGFEISEQFGNQAFKGAEYGWAKMLGQLPALVVRLAINDIRQFGTFEPTATYTLRPGGYALIVRPPGQIALVSTKDGFFLPGGGQEDGESAEDAAIRETLEECGARIRIIDRVGVADELVFAAEEQTHYRKRCTFFRAELLTKELSAGESDHALHWASMKQAISMLRHESQQWAVSESAA